MTKVKVDFYTHTGKYYIGDEFETITPTWNTLALRQEIEHRPQGNALPDMNYTFEAVDDDFAIYQGLLNKRLVIR